MPTPYTTLFLMDSIRAKGGEVNASADSALSVDCGSLRPTSEGEGKTSPSNFILWQYRPYFDLTPKAPYGNWQTEGLVLAINTYVRDIDFARLHGIGTPSVRKSIVNQAGMPEYDVDDPRQLNDKLQSEYWKALCEDMNRFHALSPNRQSRILWLLHRLHMPKAILNLPLNESGDHQLFRGMSSISLFANGDISRIERMPLFVAADSEEGWVSVEATYCLAAIYGKFLKRADDNEYWSDVHREYLDKWYRNHDALLSRYYRVAAFAPMLRGDYPQMTRMMDAAEALIRGCEDSPFNNVIKEAMWESRVKEAMMLGDLKLAEDRALKYVETAPRFPLAYFTLGQVWEAMEDDKAEMAFAAAESYGAEFEE
jgi:hypothetical protein